MITTLDRIRAHRPCAAGWIKLLQHLGKIAADDEPLSITTVLESNGLEDALWCLRAVEGHDKEIRLFAVWCARQVQHLMTDARSIAALDVAERYAKGEATAEELEAAGEAAEAAWDGFGDSAEAAAWAVAAEVLDAAVLAASAAAWAAAMEAESKVPEVSAQEARIKARSAAEAAQAEKLKEICNA